MWYVVDVRVYVVGMWKWMWYWWMFVCAICGPANNVDVEMVQQWKWYPYIAVAGVH
jgi:hypothetical protein